MSVFTDRLMRRIRSEYRYADDMLCMYEERNREYRHRLHVARLAGDSRRCE